MEPWWKGLLERLEGLVLLGLGPPAMLSFVGTVLRRRGEDKERATGTRRVEAGENGRTRQSARGRPERSGYRFASVNGWVGLGRSRCGGRRRVGKTASKRRLCQKSTFGGRNQQGASRDEHGTGRERERDDGQREMQPGVEAMNAGGNVMMQWCGSSDGGGGGSGGGGAGWFFGGGGKVGDARPQRREGRYGIMGPSRAAENAVAR